MIIRSDGSSLIFLALFAGRPVTEVASILALTISVIAFISLLAEKLI